MAMAFGLDVEVQQAQPKTCIGNAFGLACFMAFRMSASALSRDGNLFHSFCGRLPFSPTLADFSDANPEPCQWTLKGALCFPAL